MGDGILIGSTFHFYLRFTTNLKSELWAYVNENLVMHGFKDNKAACGSSNISHLSHK